MRIVHHLTLTIALQVAGFAGGVLAVAAGWRFSDAIPPGMQVVLVVAAGMLVPRALVRRLVAAQCPSCSARAFPQGASSVTYHCFTCGHVHGRRLGTGRPTGFAAPGMKRVG